MRTKKSAGAGLASALFTPVQQRVLGLLFGQPERSFQSAELIRLAESGTGGVHRYLQQLAKSGLATVTPVGNQRYYQANSNAPIFEELHGIAIKTIGLLGPLQHALSRVRTQVQAAFVYGSVAEGTDRAISDIDLMVISQDLTYADLYDIVHPVERLLARTVNPRVIAPADWTRKRAEKDSFVDQISHGPRLFVIGGDIDIS
jgi:predicted nucleotidyltransferase